MTTCENCKFWRHDRHHREDYGICINSEVIAHMKHNAKQAYRFNERAQYKMEQLYDPYVTDKWHRCMFGEEK